MSSNGAQPTVPEQALYVPASQPEVHLPLASAATSSSPTAAPFRRILVCDLDETLVYGIYDKSAFDFRKEDFSHNNKTFYYKRPHVDALLRHATKLGFELMVFTAASAELASTVVSHVFDSLDIRPTCVLSRKHTRAFTEYDAVKQVWESKRSKPLSLLANFTDVRSTDDMLLLDDKVCSAKHEPENLRLVSAWEGEDLDDTELCNVMQDLTFIAAQPTLSTMHAWRKMRGR